MLKNIKRPVLSLIAFAALLSPPARAQDFYFQELAVPRSASTDAADINDQGLVVGSAYDEDGLVNYGFVYDGIAYHKFSVPDSSRTWPAAINNDGLVVGTYLGTQGSGGFFYDIHSGAFWPYDGEVADLSGALRPALPEGMAENGVLVGWTGGGPYSLGWVDDGGSITQLLDPDDPTRGHIVPLDVNDRGQIVGYRSDSSAKAFLFENGSYEWLLPDLDNVFATGINDSGQIVGRFDGPNGTTGFLLDGAVLDEFQYPDSPWATYTSGVNSHGTIVGSSPGDGSRYSVGFIASREPLPAAVCGRPDYDKATEKAAFVWAACNGTGRYFLRVAAGGSSDPVAFRTVIDPGPPVAAFTPFSFEANDEAMFEDDGTLVSNLHVRHEGQDGFDFQTSADRVCVTFEQPSDVEIFVGRNRIPLRGNALDLAASSTCIPQEVAIDAWTAFQNGGNGAGVTATGNRIAADTPRWVSTVNSVALSDYQLEDDYTVHFVVDHTPGEPSVIGLGVNEYTRNWRDIDYAFRVGPTLSIYEKGAWQTGGFAVNRGDVLSIHVGDGRVSYRHNGIEVAESSYGGRPDFYVDTSFGTGAYIVTATTGGG